MACQFPPILQGLADTPPPPHSLPSSPKCKGPLPFPMAEALSPLGCLSWWGSQTMRTNAHCIEEQTEAQRGGELLSRSHSKSWQKQAQSLLSGSQACRPVFLGGGGGEGRVPWSRAFMLLPLNRETQECHQMPRASVFPLVLRTRCPLDHRGWSQWDLRGSSPHPHQAPSGRV